MEPVVRLMAEGVKTVSPVKHGAGKGFMKAPSTDQEKPPVLLCEDSKHALEHISSIMTSEDYEDLGNHSTEVIGGVGTFFRRSGNHARRPSVRPFPLAFNLAPLFCVSGLGRDGRANGTVS